MSGRVRRQQHRRREVVDADRGDRARERGPDASEVVEQRGGAAPPAADGTEYDAAGWVDAHSEPVSSKTPVVTKTTQGSRCAASSSGTTRPTAATSTTRPAANGATTPTTTPTSTTSLLAVVALIAGGTLIPFTLFAFGQSRLPAEIAGAFLNIEPLVGAVAGVVVFGDPAGPVQLGGGAAILGGIALVLFARSPTRRSP